MLASQFLFATLAVGIARASVLPEAKLLPIDRRANVLQNCNSANNRFCWMNGALAPFDANSDSERVWPITNVEKFYDIHVSEAVLSPDGVQKKMLVIDGKYPGTLIEAQWGDRLTITVHNDMKDNGTSMHWHGIIQANSTTQDGVNGVTECPIAPGQSRRYSFIATQHGTTWYHSHYSGQYGDGIVGTMIIHGPATANYDEDLGTYPITDYYAKNVYQLGIASQSGGPPTAPSALINGSMKVGSVGTYFNTKVQAQKRYRLRLINTSLDNMFQVSLDNHNFQVIAADFVPIKPFNTTWLFIGIGQRYDVIITTNQAPSAYWFRTQVTCGSNTLSNAGGIKAIFSYSNVNSTPNSSPIVTAPTTCADMTQLIPQLLKPVPSDQFVYNDNNNSTDKLTIALTSRPLGSSPQPTVNSWRVNGSELDVEWDHPTLKYVLDNQVNLLTPKPGSVIGGNVIDIGEGEKFHFFAIQNTGPVPHPIHLHGHDFYILGQLTTQYTAGLKSQLNFASPMRRDVALLPGFGSLVIAFESDNPGAWLMHCHIAWHVAQGLGVQFLERKSLIQRGPLQQMDAECKVWDQWYNTTIYKKFDSGLKARKPTIALY